MRKISKANLTRRVKSHKSYMDTRHGWGDTKGERFYFEGVSVYDDIKNAELKEMEMEFCNIRTDFTKVNMTEALFDHCNFIYNDFNNCDLRNVRFRNCSFDNVTFRNCKWTKESTFVGCHMSNCEFVDTYPPLGVFRYTLIRDCIGLPKYVQISNVGSRDDNLIYDYDNDIMYVGCQEITMAQFVEAVKDRHTGRYAYGNSGKALIEYNNIISMLTTLRQYYDENNLLNNKQEKTAEFDDETEDETAEVEEIEDDYEDEDEGFIAGCDCRNCRPDLYNEDGSRKSVVADPCPDYEEEKN